MLVSKPDARANTDDLSGPFTNQNLYPKLLFSICLHFSPWYFNRALFLSSFLILPLVPIIMAGIFGIFCMIVAVLITNKINEDIKGKDGYQYFFAGVI